MTKAYVEAAERVGWLLEGVERWIELHPGAAVLARSDIRAVASDRRATDDEIVVALTALADVGGVERVGDAWRVSRIGFERSAGYRRGVSDALRFRGAICDIDRVTVVAAVPPSLDELKRRLVLREASDLRAAVVDVIASAQQRIVLASPFWDEETANDLQALLERRTAAGVQITLLGRAIGGPTASGVALKALVDRLEPAGCRAVAWFRASEEDALGSETFHFKVALADRHRAYLGSANFTASGLRSRMELGIVASGDIAERLARILDVVVGR